MARPEILSSLQLNHPNEKKIIATSSARKDSPYFPSQSEIEVNKNALSIILTKENMKV